MVWVSQGGRRWHWGVISTVSRSVVAVMATSAHHLKMTEPPDWVARIGGGSYTHIDYRTIVAQALADCARTASEEVQASDRTSGNDVLVCDDKKVRYQAGAYQGP